MNPSTHQQATRAKAEAAFAAFIRNFYDTRGDDPDFDKSQLDVVCRRPGTPLDGLNIYEGQTPLSFTMPCIVVNVPASQRLTADRDTPWSEVTVEVHVMTQLEEGNEGTEEESRATGTANHEAAKSHAERCAYLTELLDDETLVMTNLNVSADPDLRPVKSFSLFGYWMDGEQSQQFDLHWDDVFSYKLHCSPLDPPASTVQHGELVVEGELILG